LLQIYFVLSELLIIVYLVFCLFSELQIGNLDVFMSDQVLYSILFHPSRKDIKVVLSCVTFSYFPLATTQELPSSDISNLLNMSLPTNHSSEEDEKMLVLRHTELYINFSYNNIFSLLYKFLVMQVLVHRRKIRLIEGKENCRHLQYTYSGGEQVEPERRSEGQQFTKLGRKYQRD
jgi:hypothetical protein